MPRVLSVIWLGLLLSSGAAQTAIYKVLDEHGNVTYTDSPPADRGAAEPVQLPAINTRQPTEIRPRTSAEANQQEPDDDRPYRSARIASPEDDFTLTAGQQELTIEIALEPSLQEGHWVQLLVDGSAAGSPAQSSTQTLREMERGMHFISAQVLNRDGRMVAETEAITVHVRRPIVGGPADGQARPPGAPTPPSAPN